MYAHTDYCIIVKTEVEQYSEFSCCMRVKQTIKECYCHMCKTCVYIYSQSKNDPHTSFFRLALANTHYTCTCTCPYTCTCMYTCTCSVFKAGHPSVLLFILPCINHVRYVYCLSGLPFFPSYFCLVCYAHVFPCISL